jgi:hypothetical protein
MAKAQTKATNKASDSGVSAYRGMKTNFKTKVKKTAPKTMNEVLHQYGLGCYLTKFISGRNGESIEVWSNEKVNHLIGTIQLVEREDGEFSVSF